MSDYIIRAIAAKGRIRAFGITSKNLVEEARRLHDTSPVVTAALGRLLSAGAMMGVMMKGEKDVLTLIIKGEGPLKGLTVTADSQGRVKGYPLVPDVILPANKKGKLDVSGAIGQGSLQVIMDLGLKEPYSGQIELQAGEIAEDLAYYFAASDQTPSAVGLGVLMSIRNTVEQAGGFIIQLMPKSHQPTAALGDYGLEDEAVVARLEENVAKVGSVTDLLEQGNTPEMILEQLLGDLGLELLDKLPAEFYCGCSKEKVTKAIISIGETDLREMIAGKEPVEVKCQFCNKAYTFSEKELEELVKDDSVKYL